MKTKKHAQFLSILAGLFPWLGLMAANQAYFVDHQFEGNRVVSLMDSHYAKSLVEGKVLELPAELLSLSSLARECGQRGEVFSSETLRAISSQYSPDTATALLLQCMASMPEIRMSQALFDREFQKSQTGDLSQLDFIEKRKNDYIILFVPGWDYKSNGEVTGADLKSPREIVTGLGFENYFIEIHENGSVEQNARFINEQLMNYAATNKKVIFVSASSGGPTLEYLLGDTRQVLDVEVAGWLNICGVLNGSPVIDSMYHWPKSWLLSAYSFLKGWEISNVKSLSRASRQGARRTEGLPEDMVIVNYVGVPFSGQMSKLGKTFYSTLKELGPNDGLTLIVDALAPGYTIMSVGSDHFIREDKDIDLKTLALLPTIIRLIEADTNLIEANVF